MQFNEIFSNTPIDESIKGEAIKQGAKKAARYAKVVGKKAVEGAKVAGKKTIAAAKKANDKINAFADAHPKATIAGLSAWSGINAAKSLEGKSHKRRKHESLSSFEEKKTVIAKKYKGKDFKKIFGKNNMAKKATKNESLVEKLERVTNNVRITNEANLAGIGKSAVNGLKTFGKNVGDTAKTVGGAIKKHPVRTAAIAGTGLAGYGAYKGVKKAVNGAKKAGKAAYQDWKV